MRAGDGCCPAGCDHNTDIDCPNSPAICKQKKTANLGKHTFSLARAFGRNLKTPNAAKLVSDISRARSKLTRRFTRAEFDGTGVSRGCDTVGDIGTLEGKVTVTYSGLEASWRRINERNEDATERRKFLERDVEAAVPVGIEVKLTNSPDWTGSDTPLVAEFDLRVPGWAATMGNRALLAVGLFGNAEKYSFEHSARVHPLYFTFPYKHTDELAIELPPGWQVGSVPKARPPSPPRRARVRRWTS